MSEPAYGLWAIVAIDSLLVIAFAWGFFHPRGGRDWRALGGFSAFMVALFTEMYGIPLTIYFLSGALGVGGLDLTHADGHLWNDLVGWGGDPHLSPFHFVSYVLIVGGFWLIVAGWRALHAAQRAGGLATTGIYARVRHPQYAGFMAIMLGFLVQWPTLLTVLMFPVLVVAYRRLARAEEREVRASFGTEWDRYAARTPRFLPSRRASAAVQRQHDPEGRADPGRALDVDPPVVGARQLPDHG